MNNDLISRSALKKAIAEFHQKENDRLHNPLWDSIGLNALNRLIDYAPTVVNEYTKGFADGERSGRNFPLTDEEKAILVRQWQPQGEWIEEAVPVGLIGRGNRQRRCSLCGHRDIQAKTQEVPYCWFCGAKMREADNDKVRS